jgi:hypothetical protein
MPSTYVISTGALLDPDGNPAGSGYAGQPPHVNDVLAIVQHSVGPLPPGLYTVGAPIDSPHLGPFALPLTPDPSNVMYGRDGFYCHGDSLAHPGYASDGCIIMPRNVRERLNGWTDRTLQVVLTPPG